MKLWKKIRIALLVGTLLLCAMLFSACSTAGGEDPAPAPPDREDGVLVYAALNPVSSETTKLIDKFNQDHEDVRIEIADYSDEGGFERLRTELVLGQVPDIMEMHYFGKAGPTGPEISPGAQPPPVVPGSYAGAKGEYWMPYRQMAQKGYLEDLWPWIENDPELGREGVQQAPMEAAEVDGGLYVLFRTFAIFTMMGRESVVGERYSWSMEDLMEVYGSMPEDSSILRYNLTRQQVFDNLLRFSIERFVNRETGETDFDSQGFRDLVGFLEAFPEEAAYEDPVAAEEEVRRNIKYGRQMLEGMMIYWPIDIVASDAIMGERAAFPGYPTSDGSSGSFFYPSGTILAMSSVCRNKEAAWEYIRNLIYPRAVRKKLPADGAAIPVNVGDYAVGVQQEIDQMLDIQKRESDPEGYVRDIFQFRHFICGPYVPLTRLLTEEDTQRHRELIEHTNQLYWPEDDLTDIVWEVLGPYFAGDWTMDRTVQMLNNRVGLYLKEAM